MKAQTESKAKQRLAIVLVIVAILSVAWAIMSSRPGESGTAAAPASAGKARGAQKVESLDPRLRIDLLANSENVKYEGKATNIFRAGDEPVIIPKVKVSPIIQPRQIDAQGRPYIPPPPPPPITLKFFGVTNSKGEKPKVFLSQGDDVWIAREGDVVNRHYKIVRILSNPAGTQWTVEVEDLLNSNRQSIRLTEG
jgi:hypothetical protein